MSEFKYTGEEVTVELVFNVARLLEANGIPCILINDCMHDIFGFDVAVTDIEFVIPDDLMDKAVDVLRAADFADDPIVPQGELKCRPFRALCERARGRDITRFEPIHWFHLAGEDAPDEFHPELCLHQKSDYFWNLPDLVLGPVNENDPHFMLATDRRLPGMMYYGRLNVDIPPIKVPRPARYVEAMMLLCARDAHTRDRGAQWALEIQLLRDLYFDRGCLDELLRMECFYPQFQVWWENLCEDDTMPANEEGYVTALRWMEEGYLPDTLFPWLCEEEDPFPGYNSPRAVITELA
ncbi:hypothetical protein BO70DRAFT_47652 [Aspergillus heteromorphus CBS 117.55]|uniref:Uncharacterized protein n=1 Tax=Aspergillus heteromorphus CBS 117.55 TaxID=1448321 RepID=A0A317W524_9EURO|nr:uncharacterized protein BO70DRAFT_47652 [Aspergillus heteromorphus CBS 117.55]PWY80671.1 hypothetical protein BO70DRAFT_47652 [Aspergillus heteromorphus CBS 117.55]